MPMVISWSVPRDVSGGWALILFQQSVWRPLPLFCHGLEALFQHSGATAVLKYIMERETLLAQTESSAGTAQLPLTMGLCVLHEAFWVGINFLSLHQKGAPLGPRAEPTGRGSSDMRAEVLSYTEQVQRHWSDTQRPPNQPQAPGTEALHSLTPLEGQSAPLELCVALPWRRRAHLLVHPVLTLGLAGDFCLALLCTRKMWKLGCMCAYHTRPHTSEWKLTRHTNVKNWKQAVPLSIALQNFARLKQATLGRRWTHC